MNDDHFPAHEWPGATKGLMALSFTSGAARKHSSLSNLPDSVILSDQGDALRFCKNRSSSFEFSRMTLLIENNYSLGK